MSDDVQTGRSSRAQSCEDRPVVLHIDDLTKDFGKLRAVDHLSLSVCRGDIFGFLGPNGAGKTTTIRMIFGLIYPTSGSVRVLDHRVPGDREDALKHLGGFVEVPAFYANMTARRNLTLIGDAWGRVRQERVDEVLSIVGLRERADSKVGDYSHGMRQRLGIASALLHEPELIILDEPTSGLDPQGMKDVRELIRELGRRGTTVFLSSHLLHEVEQVCTRAVIINRGRTVVEGPVSALRPRGNTVRVLTSDQGRAEEYLVVTADDGSVPELVRRLVAAQLDVLAVVPAPEQGLEDFFLELTQSADVDAGRTTTAGPPADAASTPGTTGTTGTEDPR